MNDETPMADDQNGGDVMLASAQNAISNLSAQFSRVYEDLTQRGEFLKRREEQVRDREERAAQSLADAQREATAMIERARQHEADLLHKAEAEAARIVEHGRSIEGQIAQRLAEVGQREQQLDQRDAQIDERAQRQRAERDWLNEYAQRLTGLAAELERTMAEPASQGYGSAA